MVGINQSEFLRGLRVAGWCFTGCLHRLSREFGKDFVKTLDSVQGLRSSTKPFTASRHPFL